MSGRRAGVDAATIELVATGLDGPTALSVVGTTLWVLEARIGSMAVPRAMPARAARIGRRRIAATDAAAARPETRRHRRGDRTT